MIDAAIPSRIEFCDSHTEGEPTRIMRAPFDLGSGNLAERAEVFRKNFAGFRSGSILEPRGSDIIVAGLIVPPDGDAACGIIFYNSKGLLGMCGHGTIGLVTTLHHQGKLAVGDHRIETPVGDVTATLHPDGRVSVRNVASWVYGQDVAVSVPGWGDLVGDIAYGGNWFFLVKESPLPVDQARIEELSACTIATMEALKAAGITGKGGAEIDHVELFGPPTRPDCGSKNFVMCPGGQFDRSPCGTGTSAKLACLAARGKLAPGEVLHQESIIGSSFSCHYELGEGGAIQPTISGRAWIVAEGTLLFDDSDPFRAGTF